MNEFLTWLVWIMGVSLVIYAFCWMCERLERPIAGVVQWLSWRTLQLAWKIRGLCDEFGEPLAPEWRRWIAGRVMDLAEWLDVRSHHWLSLWADVWCYECTDAWCSGDTLTPRERVRLAQHVYDPELEPWAP